MGIAAAGRTDALSPSRQRILLLYLLSAPFVLPVVAAIWGVSLALLHVGYSYSGDYGEALTLTGALRIADGGLGAGYAYNAAYYQAPVLDYPPVFPLIVAGLYRVGLPLLVSGRVLALLGYVGVGVALVLLVRREGVPRWLALACVIIPFGCYPFFMWSGVARIDALALAFNLFGFYLATSDRSSIDDSNFKSAAAILRLCGAALCFALAIFTKQSMVAAPAAVILAGLLTRGRRRWILALTGLTAAISLLFLLAMQAATSGSYIAIITAERNSPFSIGRMLIFFALFAGLFAALLFLGGVAWARLRKEGPALRFSAIMLYWPVAFVIDGAVGKIGSADYYLMSVTAATILLAVAGYTRLVGDLGASRQADTSVMPLWQRISFGGALLTQVVALAVVLIVSRSAAAQDLLAEPAVGPALTYLRSNSSADVFSDAPGLLLAAGRTYQIYDWFIFRHTNPVDSQPERAEVADASRGRWAVMVLSFDPSAPVSDEMASAWPPDLLQAIRQRYRTVEVTRRADGTPRYYVLEPR